MPVNPQDFFAKYVLAPYESWIADELCEWKAFAVAGGLNALIEHSFRQNNPNDLMGTNDYQDKLGEYRKRLPNAEDHDHIRYVVEVFKHVERTDRRGTRRSGPPSEFSAMKVAEAGAFSKEFASGFDVVRWQLGFPYKKDAATPEVWLPLRQPVERCIGSWKQHFGMLG
jgi:hypothetical protein